MRKGQQKLEFGSTAFFAFIISDMLTCARFKSKLLFSPLSAAYQVNYVIRDVTVDMRFSLAVSLFFKVCFTVLKSHNLNKPFSHRLVKIDLKIYYILELLLLYKNWLKMRKILIQES